MAAQPPDPADKTVFSGLSRRAFLVGNSHYDPRLDLDYLGNAKRDVEAMAFLLEALGWEVEKPLVDATGPELETAVRQFSKKLSDGDVVLFFFSGHGYSPEKHLNIMIGADPAGEDLEPEENEVNVETVGFWLSKRNTRLGPTLLVIDACREKTRPYTKGAGTVSLPPAVAGFVNFALSAPGIYEVYTTEFKHKAEGRDPKKYKGVSAFVAASIVSFQLEHDRYVLMNSILAQIQTELFERTKEKQRLVYKPLKVPIRNEQLGDSLRKTFPKFARELGKCYRGDEGFGQCAEKARKRIRAYLNAVHSCLEDQPDACE